MNLNPEQKTAIQTRKGAFLVLASPGSGKTEVLIQRAKTLLDEGISTNQLLALTFTVNASSEMAKRVGVSIPKIERAGYRTFHSFGLNLIRKEASFLPYRLSSDPFPAGNVVSKLLNEAMKQQGVGRKDFDLVRGYISRKKRNRIAPQANRIAPQAALEDLGAWEPETNALIYQGYETSLCEAGLLDYDDLIARAVDLLEIPQVRERWQFLYCMVDEFHDTDFLQLKLLQLVTEKHGNIFCVADANQNIYSWRGSDIGVVLDFQKHFPNAKIITLPQNYRSTQAIVAFVKENAPLKSELTESMRTDNELGRPVEFKMFASSDTEAESVLASADPPGKCAVLARTNAQLAVFETLCVEHQIRFFLLGKAGYWHQPEMRQLVHLMDFLLSPRGPTNYSHELVLPLRGAVKTLPASEAVKQIIDRAKLEELYGSDDEEDNFVASNLQTAVKIAGRFGTLSDFTKHAHKASHASRKSKNALTLGTIHSSKGMEFENVFVVGVSEGTLPHKRAEIEEEKRVFYVAISRAAKRLQISWSGTSSSFVIKYLTPEIKAKLQDNQERLQKQTSLFGG